MILCPIAMNCSLVDNLNSTHKPVLCTIIFMFVSLSRYSIWTGHASSYSYSSSHNSHWCGSYKCTSYFNNNNSSFTNNLLILRTKTREMSVTLKHPDGGSVKSDNSPSKRRGHSSPKIKPSLLHCNGNSVQLSDYESEPRRAGSPERLDLDQSTRTVDSLSTSTFIDSSLKVPV